MSTRRYRVMVIDDEPAVHKLLQVLVRLDARLELSGSFADGARALAQLRHHHPDAVVCDLEMPRLSGLEMLPHLRAACPDSVIVLYTAAPERAADALALGADAIIDKAAAHRLPDTIVELLDSKRGYPGPRPTE